VRPSFAFYNTKAEADLLIATLRAIGADPARFLE
jgi:selenocysteine lyase/cysteine desulfurase